MTDDRGSVTVFLSQMMAGDAAAVAILWERFFPRLLGLARKTLGNRSHGTGDAEDAVQSAFASFWNRAVDGQFDADMDRQNLWNLLGLITVRKSLRQLRRESAARRGGGKVVSASSLEDHDRGSRFFDDVPANLSPVELDLYGTELLEQLDDELREIAMLRLLGFRNREIAERMSCTERSIERKLAKIRSNWETEWEIQS